jgi:hypothetical protein
VVAGFAGFGGFDYMRQAGDGGHVPSLPLRDVPWGGNGFYAADNDVFGATACLEAAARLWAEGGGHLAGVLENGMLTAKEYAAKRDLKPFLDACDGLRSGPAANSAPSFRDRGV